MRAVLDTNVFISAAIIPQSIPSRVLDGWYDNRYDLVLSSQMLDEVTEVLQRPEIRARHGWSDEALAAFLQGLATFCVITPGVLDLSGVSDDPDDDMFFACAVEGNADYIVSGDAHVLAVGAYQNVQVVTPRQFLDILAEQEAES